MRLPPEANDYEGPNLTPVIDVVFLLLIFFLVATRYQEDTEERRLNQIKLPTAALAQPASMTPKLVINITSDGRFVIEDHRIHGSGTRSRPRHRQPQQPQPGRADLRGRGKCLKARRQSHGPVQQSRHGIRNRRPAAAGSS